MAQTMTDQDRLQIAFAELRDRGYWARAAHEGGWTTVPRWAQQTGKIVFWAAWLMPICFDRRRIVSPLLLEYEGEREVITAELEDAGLRWHDGGMQSIYVDGSIEADSVPESSGQ
jgi:hypothetical protein